MANPSDQQPGVDRFLSASPAVHPEVGLASLIHYLDTLLNLLRTVATLLLHYQQPQALSETATKVHFSDPQSESSLSAIGPKGEHLCCWSVIAGLLKAALLGKGRA